MVTSSIRYQERDVVATDRGRGVVAAVLTDGFETPDLETERTREHCSAMKDELLQTKRWRNRF